MLSCDLHDYIEIACMFQYPVRLGLKSGEVVEGKAVDTQRNEDKQECIEIALGEASSVTDEATLLVVLETISKMEALIENPHFKEVGFEPIKAS